MTKVLARNGGITASVAAAQKEKRESGVPALKSLPLAAPLPTSADQSHARAPHQRFRRPTRLKSSLAVHGPPILGKVGRLSGLIGVSTHYTRQIRQKVKGKAGPERPLKSNSLVMLRTPKTCRQACNTVSPAWGALRHASMPIVSPYGLEYGEIDLYFFRAL